MGTFLTSLLVISGVVLTIVGALWLAWPSRKPPPDPDGERSLTDIEKLLEQVNKLLDKFDKRLRPGVIIMVVGVALIVLGLVFAPRTVSPDTPPTPTPESLEVSAT